MLLFNIIIAINCLVFICHLTITQRSTNHQYYHQRHIILIMFSYHFHLNCSLVPLS